MASIINSISFNNFFNYYGEFEDNTYQLEEGVNIIVADNGAGKSKFFNAFLWLFDDQVLDSDDKVQKSIKSICVKVLSDKAKNETDKYGHVKCGIQIEFTFGSRYKYQIIKSFTGTRLGEAITDANSWSFVFNNVQVNRSELVLHRYKPIYDEDEKKLIIDQLIKPKFRKYSFFQGEEVDNIIDFGDKKSIEDAVQHLTDISKYEKLVEYTEEFKAKAFKDLNTQNKSNDSLAKNLKAAIDEKAKIEQHLTQEQELLEQFRQAHLDAEKEFNSLNKQYANAEKRKELDDKLRPLNKSLKLKQEEFERFLDLINNKFFDGNFAWISMGFDNVLENFRKEKEKYVDLHFEKKALKNIEENPNNYFHFLPVDSPDAVSLENMIDNEHCYVCDRPAKKGSNEYEYLVKLKNRPSESKKEIEYVKNNLKGFFDSIQTNSQPFYTRIPYVKANIIELKEKEELLKKQIEDSNQKIKSLKDQRKDVLVAGNDDELSSAEIIANYQGSIRRMESAKNKIDDIITPKIKRFKSELVNIDNEIESLNKTQDIPQGYKDNFAIAKDLAEATAKAKERVYDNMIGLLEEHANKHFKELTINNDLEGGILKFDKTPSGSIEFNYIDSKGNLVSGSSEGFQRMKKFAVVMAIISANNSQYNYPLLADAPISAFGEGFTEGFFEATGKVFPQSIILVKELYKRSDDQKINELGKKLLKDDFVKTMYVNHVPAGAEQTELVTTYTKLK